MRLLVPVFVLACVVALHGRPVLAQSSPPVQPLTEAEALARQRAADPRLRAILSRSAAVRASQAERTRWPNPVMAFSRESVGGTSDVFLVGRQELPVSSRRRHLRAAGGLAVDAADAEPAFDIGQLQAALRQAFTTLLAAQERETVLDEAVRDLDRLVELLRVREQAGEGSRYDRLRGERALVDLRDERAAASIARAGARVELARFLGPNVAPDGLTAAGTLDLPPPPPVDELIEQALQVRADYRATALMASQYERERQAARALRVPTPLLGYGLKRSGGANVFNNGYQLAIEVPVPLFNRGQSAVALVEAEAARTDLERASLGLLVASEVRGAHVRLTLQRQRESRYRQSVADAAEPLTGIARVAYEEGELGILELLDAQRQLVDARLQLLTLAEAGRLAAIELDRVTGVEVKP
jgi:cobalt-zinc-cadmium efflux system outer membrane protein